MRSSNSADARARASSSDLGSVPRWFNARHASRIVSRSYRTFSSSGCTPFSPRRAPGRICERSRCKSAACARLSCMYGHIASMSGPIDRPFSDQIHAGDAFGIFGRVGPETMPPAISFATKGSKPSVVDIEINASQLVYPLRSTFRIMYEPSPSSNPAKYAASVSFMRPEYTGAVTKPEYWAVACRNLARAEADATAPSLFDLLDVEASA